jgi:hypothetical protein
MTGLKVALGLLGVILLVPLLAEQTGAPFSVKAQLRGSEFSRDED